MCPARVTLTKSTERHSVLFRVIRKVLLGGVRSLSGVLSQERYMFLLVLVLKSFGVNFRGMPLYISPRCWLDVTDLSKITFEGQTVVSHYVSILTHDYSMARMRDAITNKRNVPEIALVKPVHIGFNSFVGLGSILLPGTTIGSNCVIGAGSVVRGNIPDNSLVAGNPARIIGDSLEYGNRKLAESGL